MFPIGSLSKQFCSTAILMLQEQGKLNVQESITKYFPEYTAAEKVTIEDLLTMRSGISEHQEGLEKGEYSLSVNASEAENQQAILNWIYNKDLEFVAGTRFKYSNTNYLLLSMIVEKVTEQSYKDFLVENIFTPLGMKNTGFYEELLNDPELAENTVNSNGPIDPELKGLTQGCGDLVSNAKDIDKWLTALGEHTLISEESFKQMTTNYSLNVGYGYGVYLTQYGGIFHDGAIVSYNCGALVCPKDKFNVFTVSNEIDFEKIHMVELALQLADVINNDGIHGDVNCDGRVNIKDATKIQKYIAQLVTLTESQMAFADVTMSGKVDINDVTAIQEYIANITTRHPIGNPMH